MKIGNIEFGPNPLFLAPMEDVTDIGFRLLCKRFGASMVYTEFVSAEALIRDVQSTVRKLTISDEERPVGIQIYGRDVEAMVEAAKIVEQAGPDLIDLNFGCPVKKVAGKGAGAGMLQNIPRMLEITSKVVDAVKLPVTVKTRLGWDSNNLIITELAEQLQDCGIKALTIHGRTRAQMYTGDADWTLIGEIKRNPRIHIPIIGNGDIKTAEDAKRAFETYGVDAVMIGRATFGQPWIFKEIGEALSLRSEGVKECRSEDDTFRSADDTLRSSGVQECRSADDCSQPHNLTTSQPHSTNLSTRQLINSSTVNSCLSLDDKIDILLEQLKINVDRIDEYRGILHTRRHLAASPIFKGIPDFRQTRIAMLRAETMEELTNIIEEIRIRLKKKQ
ncbi:MAG: tRNA dihydrouridine synthase DusB [Prevotella sp.]|nr:tRNA dihydrouridine synthase DusB [Prevotella sp.]